MATDLHSPLTRGRRAAVFALAALALVTATSAGGAPSLTMPDEDSYDVLTYSAWGRQNNLSGATCTGLGPAGHTFLGESALGPTHASFRCQVQVGEAPAGSVVAKVVGPQSLRVVSVSGGKLRPDRGVGAVPSGASTLENIDALDALQKGAWAKAHHVTRVLCYGLGSYRVRYGSALFFAFSCATFDSRNVRGQQVLVTVSGNKAVRVVRTLAK